MLNLRIAGLLICVVAAATVPLCHLHRLRRARNCQIQPVAPKQARNCLAQADHPKQEVHDALGSSARQTLEAVATVALEVMATVALVAVGVSRWLAAIPLGQQAKHQ